MTLRLDAEFDRAMSQMIAVRRDIHSHPELSFEETRTAGIAAEKLRALGLEVKTGVGGTGVTGLIRGETPGKTLLIRADMDGLPVTEANETDYCSRDPGKMHA